MPIKASGLLGATLITLVAMAGAARAENDDWVNHLPVKPGSSLNHERKQQISLFEKYEFRFIRNKAFLSGRSCMVFDNGASSLCPDGGTATEITFEASAKTAVENCENLLKGDLADGSRIEITGQGKYVVVPPKHAKESVIVFKLSSLSKCRLSSSSQGASATLPITPNAAQ